MLFHYAECRYVECHYAECRYAECRYAECLYAECLATFNPGTCTINIFTDVIISLK
jgi:hypothetical protein